MQRRNLAIVRARPGPTLPLSSVAEELPAIRASALKTCLDLLLWVEYVDQSSAARRQRGGRRNQTNFFYLSVES